MNAKNIIYIINDYYKIDVMSRSRKQNITIPRYLCMWILNNHNNKRYSYSALGKIFNKNHGTVIYGINLINNLIQNDKNFIKEYSEIREIIANMVYKNEFYYYEKILDKRCTINMKNWDMLKFKNDYPTLYKCILESMIEVDNKKIYKT